MAFIVTANFVDGTICAVCVDSETADKMFDACQHMGAGNNDCAVAWVEEGYVVAQEGDFRGLDPVDYIGD